MCKIQLHCATETPHKLFDVPLKSIHPIINPSKDLWHKSIESDHFSTAPHTLWTGDRGPVDNVTVPITRVSQPLEECGLGHPGGGVGGGGEVMRPAGGGGGEEGGSGERPSPWH